MEGMGRRWEIRCDGSWETLCCFLRSVVVKETNYDEPLSLPFSFGITSSLPTSVFSLLTLPL